jgi:hypothetical protein
MTTITAAASVAGRPKAARRKKAVPTRQAQAESWTGAISLK